MDIFGSWLGFIGSICVAWSKQEVHKDKLSQKVNKYETFCDNGTQVLE